ncbi:MAG: hypothetical protein EHM35_16530 [Planctomycetaceae bacterium]|nr:MAG: hypothetical protein EHM35_16530 [Planctomycetaceae bacterium]
MTQPFGTIQDNSGPKIGAQDLIGRPLIMWVNDYKKNVGTRNTAQTGRLADPVICDIVDLRPPMGGDPILYRNVWIFTGGLIKTLKTLVGTDPRLLMLTQAPNSYGGRSYTITDLSGDSRAAELGGTWMAANPEFVRSEAPPDPEPWVPNQQPQQPQNQGWPQGSVPAQQWQGQPQQGQQWQQSQPQPQFQQPQQQPVWGQPQQPWQQPQQQAHHEQGPPPAWAQQPVQQAQPQYQQPPMPPQPPAQGSVLERLAAQHQNNDQARQQVQQPYNQEQERQAYGY